MNPHPVADLHRATVHGEEPPPDLRRRLVAFRPLDPTNRPEPFKRYRNLQAVALPRAVLASSLPAVDVLSGFSLSGTEPVDHNLLGTLLYLSAGVTRVIRLSQGPIWFRSAMSAGNLHPVEVYVVDDTGVSHYQPLEHALVPLRSGQGAGTAESGATTLVLTGVPFRTCWKYGERGWRHLWWDAGTMLASLVAVANAHGLGVQVQIGFPDAAMARLVGVDGVDEVPLVVVRLGPRRSRLPDLDSLEPVTVQAEPVARQVLRFPLVEEAHAASALDDWEAVTTWRRSLESQDFAAIPPVPIAVAPPVGTDPYDRVEDVIRRRGSPRAFRRQEASAQLLEWGLAAATRSAVRFDAAPGTTLLEHLVNVHDVAGQEVASVEEARQCGAALCLGQDLGGDSAYTVFHSADLGRLMDALGARGYRAAQLEAGMVAGRLALNATALGAGATGLTFYDNLVSQYFDTAASPMLATAVGIPATSSAPSGTPGAPAELRRLA